MIYFGTRLSENISRREPEGYLICLNVPVARSGVQEYLPSELGLPEPDSRLIPVLRPEEEVFSPACMASFEGMPVTDDHPAARDGVTAENIRYLQKGHVVNIRRGAGKESDLLLADLMVTDPLLVQEILDGKREISCGYTYTLCEEDGKYIQREIRGNHVAVVDAGRAGPRVSIRDHRTRTEERSSMMKKKSLWRAKLMARMAKDGDVEGLTELITETMEEPAAVIVPAEPSAGDPLVNAVAAAVTENLDPAADEEEAPVVVETPVEQPVVIDCGPQILEALQRIISLLSGTDADCEEPEHTGDEEPSAAEEAIAETAAETVAENLAEAAVEAIAEAMDPGLETAVDEEDPVEALVEEILEGDEGEEAPAVVQEEILSGILEPEETQDEEDPEDGTLAADALRAALASFRPKLARMTPKERQRFNADVAARMKALSRKQGKGNAYAALRKAGAHDAAGRSLGQKIMESRNANLRRA